MIKGIACGNCGNTFNLRFHGNVFYCNVCGTWSYEENGVIKIYSNPDPIPDPIPNPIPNIKTNTSPRRKSRAGKIILIIAIIYAIQYAICFIANAIAKDTSVVPDKTTATTIPTTSSDNPPGIKSAGENTEYIPIEVPLVDLKPYTCMPYYTTYSIADIFDNHYANGIYSCVDGTDGTCSCTYRLNMQYDRLTFTSGIVEFGRGDPGEVTIKIYGDGKEIYTRTLDCTSDSLFEDLDITGVKDIRIEMYSYCEPEVSLRGYTSLYPCIWEATLHTAR